MTIKTPAEIAEATIRHTYRESWTKARQIEVSEAIVAAIEADRAQRHPWQVIAEHGKGNPEAIVGHYSSSFEAYAVSDEWNRVNGKHGINYRVEEDV